MFLAKFFGKSPVVSPESHGKTGRLLEEALGQRPKFHLTLDKRVTSLKDLHGSLHSYGPDLIVIELNNLEGSGQKWIGSQVEVYFELIDKRSRRGTFYGFSSLIRAIDNRNGRVFLCLDCPKTVAQSQRRKALRLGVGSDALSEFESWACGLNGGFDSDTPFLTLQEIGSNQCSLMNFSAGGLRLSFSRKFLESNSVKLESRTRIIFFVKANKVSLSCDRELWLLSQLNNLNQNQLNKSVEVGFEFVAEGKLDETDQVRWKKVSGNVIDNIATWTYDWHLQHVRQAGVSMS